VVLSTTLPVIGWLISEKPGWVSGQTVRANGACSEPEPHKFRRAGQGSWGPAADACGRAGTPQMIVSHGADQPYRTGRVAELSIGAIHDGPAADAGS
jgi:hypothetical protein